MNNCDSQNNMNRDIYQKFQIQRNISDETLTNHITFLKNYKYQDFDYLGVGHGSILFKARSNKFGDVAIKIKQNVGGDQSLENMEKEENILKKLDQSEHFIKFYEKIKSPGFVYFVTELYDCTLAQIMEEQYFTNFQICELAEQILNGMQELQRQDVVHCNIRPEKIVYNLKKKLFQICDFRASYTSNDFLQNSIKISEQIKDSALYMSPESKERFMEGNNSIKLNHLADVYSFGVVLAEVLRGERIRKNEKQHYVPEINFQQLFTIIQQSEQTKAICFDLLNKMVKKNVDERLNSRDLNLLCDFFKFNSKNEKNEVFQLREKDKNPNTNNKNYMQQETIYTLFSEQGKKNSFKDIIEGKITNCNDINIIQAGQEIVRITQELNGNEFKPSVNQAEQILKVNTLQDYTKNLQQKVNKIQLDEQFMQKVVNRRQQYNNDNASLVQDPDYALYLLKEFYKQQHNINIHYQHGSPHTNKKLNQVISQHILSGTIQGCNLFKYVLQGSEVYFLEQTPFRLRKYLNDKGFKNQAIYRINKNTNTVYLTNENNHVQNDCSKTESISLLDGCILDIKDLLNPQYNIFYQGNYLPQYRGNINNISQPHNFPSGYNGIALNVERYGKDMTWLGNTTQNGVWITVFHGTKPLKDKPQEFGHIKNFLTEGFRISKNTKTETWFDAMAERTCRFKNKVIGGGNIYLANIVSNEFQGCRDDRGGAEVYTEPFTVNNKNYKIVFMSRADPTEIYSPIEFPVQMLVKDNVYVRPYKLLIKECS